MTKPQPLPVTFDAVRDKTVEQLKVMNAAIFPIRYQDKLYNECLAGELSQFAYHNDVAIGALACRVEKQPQGGSWLYILTLGVLAPYRNMGVGSALLEKVISVAKKTDSSIKEVALHVQVGNEEALKFYKDHGFSVRETVHGFYKRLDPPDALLLVKSLDSA